MAEDGRGNGARAQGLRTRRAACLHCPRHIPRLVRRPWHKPRQRRTQKVRRGCGNREIRPIGLTGTVLAGRRATLSQTSNSTFGRTALEASGIAGSNQRKVLPSPVPPPQVQIVELPPLRALAAWTLRTLRNPSYSLGDD